MNHSKTLFIGLILCSAFINSYSQESNLLVNSAEVINDGVKLYNDGKYKEALALYDQVSPSDTNYVLALYDKALACQLDSQYEKGLLFCKDALAVNPKNEHHPGIYTVYGS